ncbi:MAG: SDR family NAD(P)-dependent oxidoreductase [Clostridia bacterium]|nr:SDR family NAD(P)-dependent oxidoreductase [Clostridia bacterium]
MANIALVTGASSGIGREFVRQLAKRPEVEEIWALARNEEKLAMLVDENPEKPIRTFSVDVSDNAQVAAFFETVEAEAPTILWMANNAGWGKFCRCDELSPEESLSMIATNAGGVVNMAVRALPYMKAGSKLINTGSASAFQPLPYVGLYGATKAFVRSYSRAMNKEVKRQGITVTCMCPYWVGTNFFDAVHEHPGNAVVTKYEVMYKPEDVVRRAIRDAGRGKDMSVYGAVNRFQHVAAKLLPQRLVMWIFLKKQGLK